MRVSLPALLLLTLAFGMAELSHAAPPVKKPPLKAVTTKKPTPAAKAPVRAVAAKAPAKPATSAKPPADITPVIAHYNAGAQAFRESNMAEAAKRLKLALDLDIKLEGPNHEHAKMISNLLAATHYELGRTAYLENRFEEARRNLHLAAKLYEKYDTADNRERWGYSTGLIAETHFKEAEFPLAFSLYKRTLEMGLKDKKPDDPDLLPTYLRLGKTAMLTRQYPQAREYYERALAIQVKTAGQNDEPGKIDEKVQSTLSELSVLRNIDLGPDYLKEQPTKVTRWNDDTRTLRIHVSSGERVADWKPEYADLVMEAFREWQTALAGRMSFEFVPNREEADVVVSWTDQPMKLDGEEAASGRNQLLIWQRWIADSDIKIAVHEPGGKPAHPNNLYNVSLHEIGHMLGLLSHSKNPDDIMYYSEAFDVHQKRSLTARDIATAHGLYKLNADISNPVGVPMPTFRKFFAWTQSGNEALKRRDYREAHARFKNAMAIWPGDMATKFNMAVAAIQLQRYDEAVPLLEEATGKTWDFLPQAQETLAYALMATGEEYESRGRHKQAEERYDRALNLFLVALQNPKTTAERKEAILSAVAWLRERGAYASGAIVWNDGTPMPAEAAEQKPAKRRRRPHNNQVPIFVPMYGGHF